MGYKLIKKDPAKYYSRIEELCLKSGKPEVKADLNRLRAMTQSSSKLGKFLAKASNRTLYGLTFGGGIFMLLSAHAIAEAVTRTKNAEKGDKFSTFMEAFLGNISWIVTMPLGIKLMNAVAGLKNIGKTPEQVAQVSKALAKMNDVAVHGTKADYKIAKDAWKAAKKLGKTNFFQKILSIPGKILTYGRNVPKPYLGKATTFGAKLGNFFKKVPYWLRNKPIAILIGLGTYMAVFSPIVDKLFRKVSYALFGKPKHSMYDDEAEQKLTQETQQVQTTQQQTVQQNPFQNGNTNLLDAYKQQNQQTAQQNSQQTTNIINNQTIVNNQDNSDKTLEPVRTYIPSPEPVQLKGPDTSAIDAAIARSQAAEKLALDTLAMKF